jgi:alkylation response protein AidB-like acyl-CoA dehydrogenase
MSHHYVPPLSAIAAALAQVGLDDVLDLPPFGELDAAATDLLEEFARLVVDKIAPLDHIGDRVGSHRDPESGRVRTPPGFTDAYSELVSGGWLSVPFGREHGGGGFPLLVGVAMQEILASANVALSLCPMLTQTGVELLGELGTERQRARYLPRLVSGEWTGTMILTEPDAGSDVGALRTRAVEAEDGTWRVTGTKIFITWGDHDLTDNIVHFVLGRAPGGPPGTRGISLFTVPARLVDDDGQAGARNRVECVSTEDKLGIHASPTCVLAFDDAEAELVGEVHQGMRAMFAMMNAARLSVGVEGLALCERALQAADSYAHTRRQGRLPGATAGESVTIAEHPDVRRMLLTMRSTADAARLLVYATAQAIDVSRHHPDKTERTRAGAMAGLLVPLAKGWTTTMASEMTSMAIQVHGGLGYIEETGVAQLYRDARITSIYEGTTGIQAIDLVTRKLGGTDDGPLALVVADMARTATALADGGRTVESANLTAAATALRDGAGWLVERQRSHPLDVLAGATPFLRMTGASVAAWLICRRAVGASGPAGTHCDSARSGSGLSRSDSFFINQTLPVAFAELDAVRAGVGALDDD